MTILIDDDLHDLHDLRARFLVFIHSLLESLRASGVSVGYHLKTCLKHIYFQIPASYVLVPMSSPICLVCALHPDLSASKAKSAAIEVFQNSKHGKRSVPLLPWRTLYRLTIRDNNVLLGEFEHGPALIIT